MAELKNNIADWKMSVSTTQDTLLGLTVKSFRSSRWGGRGGSLDLERWIATADHLGKKDNSQVYSVILRVL